ncbi:MAG: transcriptional repressor [Verrucomicrobiota bacterium]
MPASPRSDTTETLEEWEAQLRRSGQRLTIPRRVILKAMLRLNRTFDADALLAEARREDELISLATIYRTIGLMENCGLLRKAESDGDKQVFEVGSPVGARVYIVCQDCGKTVPMKDDCLDLRERFLSKSLGFSANEISVRVTASCDQHAESGHCDKHD